jgi:hypothetical protein
MPKRLDDSTPHSKSRNTVVGEEAFDSLARDHSPFRLPVQSPASPRGASCQTPIIVTSVSQNGAAGPRATCIGAWLKNRFIPIRQLPVRGSVRLIQSLARIKRASGIWPDRA